jgi:hypothetical protein
MTEWLADARDLRPGMQVLDLGCGRAMSSVFLRREFGVQAWATDLWFSPSANLQRMRHPIHPTARSTRGPRMPGRRQNHSRCRSSLPICWFPALDGAFTNPPSAPSLTAKPSRSH